jgi:hypothetical protein
MQFKTDMFTSLRGSSPSPVNGSQVVQCTKEQAHGWQAHSCSPLLTASVLLSACVTQSTAQQIKCTLSVEKPELKTEVRT